MHAKYPQYHYGARVRMNPTHAYNIQQSRERESERERESIIECVHQQAPVFFRASAPSVQQSEARFI